MTYRSTYPPRPTFDRAVARSNRFGARRRCGLLAHCVRVALLASIALQGLVAHSADTTGLAVRTIDGDDLTVPAALPAGAILVVGFKQRSVDETRPWREAIDALGESAPPVFNVQVVEAAPRWVRWIIVRAARREASLEDYGSILIATKDELGWRSLVGFQSSLEDSAYVVRINGSGQTCFHYAGPVTEEALHSSLVADCTR